MNAESTVVRRAVRMVATGAGVVVLVVSTAALPAVAAPPGRGGGHGGGGTGGSTGSATAGNDISYPQCGSTFPKSPTFGIVGVTGGLANDLNPCFGPSSSYPAYAQSELYWAVATPSGTPTVPKASLYVNTGDPGDVYNRQPVADWPTTGTTPYGPCTTTTVTFRATTSTVGVNSNACAWQYGYDRASQDAAWLTAAANAIDAQGPAVSVAASTSSYPWWLDVETANTWQSGSSGLAMNVADLQGMVAGLGQAGATGVGVYSTGAQWSQVTGGTTSASGSLYGLPDWIPGATTAAGATANCGLASFTGGTVTITQWTGSPDNDEAC